MPPLTSSAALTGKHLRALVFGPPGKSKTFSSLSLSEKCPPDFSHIVPKEAPKRPKAVLDDLLWIATDSGATSGFEQQGFDVPAFDLSKIDPGKLDAEIPDMMRQIKERVEKGVTKAVIVDTVSSYDKILNYKHSVLRGLTKFDLFGAMLLDHQKFFMPLKTLPCHMVFLCHAKVSGEMDEKAKQRNQAAGLSAVIPDITGQALNIYRADCDLIFSIFPKKVINPASKQSEDGRYFLTESNMIDAKKRVLLPESLPADWREVFKVLRAGEAK
jgi:hypothetical protein